MTLPWGHRLPDYTKGDSPYGRNLVELAQKLHRDDRLVVIDVGSNIGDSALQIADATDAFVVCVEADPYYLDFLRRNTGDDPRFAIEPSLLVPVIEEASASRRAVRAGGTTRFVEDAESSDSQPGIAPAQLRAKYPELERLRLVKSDTDGYDVALVPALAKEWSDLSPVLFFEYDPRLSRESGFDPLAVWEELAALGYSDVAVWGNGGHPIGRTTTLDMPSMTERLGATSERYAPTYWDVAVAHRDDADAIAALRSLIPGEM